MSFFSICISVYETRTVQKDLNAMSMYSCRLNVYRSNDSKHSSDSKLNKISYQNQTDISKNFDQKIHLKPVEINSEELVVGDLIEIPMLMKMPCDIL